MLQEPFQPWRRGQSFSLKGAPRIELGADHRASATLGGRGKKGGRGGKEGEKEKGRRKKEKRKEKRKREKGEIKKGEKGGRKEGREREVT